MGVFFLFQDPLGDDQGLAYQYPRAALYREAGEGFALLEFYCPGCGTRLDVDLVYRDDPPLYDRIDRWHEV